jgi:WD40 repeat protein
MIVKRSHLSHNGNYIATVNSWGIINIWSLPHGKLCHTFDCGYWQKPLDGLFYECFLIAHSNYISYGGDYSIYFMENSEKIIGINNQEHKVNVWKVTEGNILYEIHNTCKAIVNFHDQSILVEELDSDLISVWSVESGKKINSFSMDNFKIHEITLGYNGKLLVISGYFLIEYDPECETEDEHWICENSIKIIELKNFEILHTLDRFRFSSKDRYRQSPSIKTSRNGKFLISIDDYAENEEKEQNTFKVWDIELGKLLYVSSRYDYLDIDCLDINQYGQLAILEGLSNTIKILDVYTGEIEYILTGHSEFITCLSIYPDSDGQFLISGSEDTTIKIWDLKTGKIVQNLSKHLYGNISFTISNNGQFLISKDDENYVMIWKLIECYNGFNAEKIEEVKID